MWGDDFRTRSDWPAEDRLSGRRSHSVNDALGAPPQGGGFGPRSTSTVAVRPDHDEESGADSSMSASQLRKRYRRPNCVRRHEFIPLAFIHVGLSTPTPPTESCSLKLMFRLLQVPLWGPKKRRRTDSQSVALAIRSRRARAWSWGGLRRRLSRLVARRCRIVAPRAAPAAVLGRAWGRRRRCGDGRPRGNAGR